MTQQPPDAYDNLRDLEQRCFDALGAIHLALGMGMVEYCTICRRQGKDVGVELMVHRGDGTPANPTLVHRWSCDPMDKGVVHIETAIDGVILAGELVAKNLAMHHTMTMGAPEFIESRKTIAKIRSRAPRIILPGQGRN